MKLLPSFYSQTYLRHSISVSGQILHFLEEPNYVLEIQKKSGDLLVQIEPPENENEFSRLAKSGSGDDVVYR